MNQKLILGILGVVIVVGVLIVIALILSGKPIKDCGSSIDCVLAFAKDDCSPAKATQNFWGDIIMVMETKGQTQDKCELYVQFTARNLVEDAPINEGTYEMTCFLPMYGPEKFSDFETTKYKYCKGNLLDVMDLLIEWGKQELTMF